MMTAEYESKILAILKRGGMVSTSKVSEELGLTREDARSILNRLWEEQKVGRRLVQDTSAADKEGGAEMWHLVGWKVGSRQTPIEPKPSDTLTLQSENKGLKAKRLTKKVRNRFDTRIAVLQFLSDSRYPVARAEVSRKMRMNKETAKNAMKVLTEQELVSLERFQGQGGHCPACGALIAGDGVYRITEEGKKLLEWLRDNRESINVIQALG